MKLNRLFGPVAALAFATSSCFFSSQAHAQVSDVSGPNATPIHGAGHDYIHGLSETVNPATGSVSVRIEVPMPAGRGLTVPLALLYNSSGAYQAIPIAPPSPGAGLGLLSFGGAAADGTHPYAVPWSLSLPILTVGYYEWDWTEGDPQDPPYTIHRCYYASSYVFQDPSGARHDLNLEVVNSPGVGDCSPGVQPQDMLEGDDGIYHAVTSSAPGGIGPLPPVTVISRDGTVFQFTNPIAGVSFPGAPLGGWVSYPSSIEDSNGNVVKIATSAGTAILTDSSGRVAAQISTINPNIQQNTISVSGLANSYTLQWGSVSSNFSVPFSMISGCVPPSMSGGGTQILMQTLTLPNGQIYQFQYDAVYHLLQKIIYPTGAWVSYAWGMNAQSEYANVICTVPNFGSMGSRFWFGEPAIQHRYVSFDGTNIAEQQDFSYSTTPQSNGDGPWTAKQTTVTTHDLVRSQSYATIYTYVPFILGGMPTALGYSPITPVESSIVYQNFDGSVAKTVTKEWGTPYLLGCQTETLSNGLTAGTLYDANLDGVATGTRRYDYGQISSTACLTGVPTSVIPAQQTTINNQSFPKSPFMPSSAALPSNAPPGINDRPCQVITYGNGVRVAETDVLYDNATTVCGSAGTPSVTSVANLPAGTHDETNYSASSTVSRGNATSTIHKCFLPATGQSCPDSNTTATFDETGQALSRTDANGNTTQYSYADNYDSGPAGVNTNTYVTKITQPQTGSTNHIQSFSYAYSDGQLISATDQNSQVTTNKYNDSLRRLTETDRPDGGVTFLTYNDAGPSPSVTNNTKIDANNNLVTTAVFDGMLHTVQAQLNSDPLGMDLTDITLDGLARPYKVSNPHRSAAAITDGSTQTQYDSLGRVIQSTKQDGSVETISYAGNCVTATDEAGIQHKSCSDAFGRLIEVDEPGGGTAGTASSGSLTISGTLQTKPPTGGTQGVGWAAVSGNDQTSTSNVTITVPNAGFETPSVGSGSYAYQYSPSGGSWTFTGTGAANNGAGLSGNGSGFTAGNPAAPDGAQVAFIQGEGSTIYQTLSGFQSNASYTVSFYAAQRGNMNSGGERFDLYLDNTLLASFFPPGIGYGLLSTPAFTTTAGSHTLKFLGHDPSAWGNSAFIDAVSVTGIATTSDTGTVTITVNNTPYTYNYGAGDTASTVGTGLTNTINAGSLVTAVSSIIGDVTVANAGFETPGVGSGTSAYQYSPSGGSWTFTGTGVANNGAGVSGNGSGFTAGNAGAPDGAQVAFIQGEGSTIYQTLSGFQAGTSYTVSFYAAQRGNMNSGGERFDLYLDSTLVASFFPASSTYTLLSTPAFTTTAGSHTLKFVGRDASAWGNAAFIDAVRVAAVTIPNAGFETPGVGSGTSAYQYSPSGGSWTFTGTGVANNGAGVSGNGSGFTAGNPAAPDGGQLAFIQGEGSTIYQTLAGFQAGASYTVSFYAAQRGNMNSGGERFDLYLDTTLLASFFPAGSTYTLLSTPAFTTTAGSHTLKFVGRDASAWGNAAFIDAVRVGAASGNLIGLTSVATGTSANYTIATSSTHSGSFSNPSFTGGTSGANLTGGTNGSGAATDAGTVQMSVGGYTATANYGTGQDTTAAAVASDLVAKIQAQLPATNPLFTISAGGANININWGSAGTAGNVTVSTTSTTTQTAYFANPSFASCTITANPQSCSTALSGGADAIPPSLTTPWVTAYQYDALGNLQRVDQKGSAPSDSSQWRTRLFTYDSLGRLLTAINPESGTVSYQYDANGNLLYKTSPAPNQIGSATLTVSYCYDALNRVLAKGYSNPNPQQCTGNPPSLPNPAVTYTYDQGGAAANAIPHVTSLSDPAGSATFGYDVMGRIASETRTINPGSPLNPVSKGVSYEYNVDGSLYKLHYPSGAIVTYKHDAAGHMVSAIDSANGINYATSASFGPIGSLTGFVSGNTVTNTFVYDNRLQPCRITASSTGAVPSNCDNSWGNLLDLRYDFHLGNGDNGDVYGIINYRDQTRNQTFTYDALNRLSSAQNAGTDCTQPTADGKTKFWGNTYGYDAWGNLLTKISTKCNSERLDRKADTQNRLHTNVGADHQYDAAGNMTYDTSGLYYSYDNENRLIGAAGYSYTYDADGNRVEKSTGGSSPTGMLYWYMSAGIVGESDLTGALKSEYVFFNGQRVARRDGVNGAGGVFYYFSDHLKSTAIVSDASGKTLNESDFYPWGGELKFQVSDPNNHYKFTGKERDQETGLDYFGARYYTNNLGRWISADWSAVPIPVPYAALGDPQTLNLYSYVRDIPTVRVDADGHEDCNNHDRGKKCTPKKRRPKKSKATPAPKPPETPGSAKPGQPQPGQPQPNAKPDNSIYAQCAIPYMCTEEEVRALVLARVASLLGLKVVPLNPRAQAGWGDPPVNIPVPAGMEWIINIANGHGFDEHAAAYMTREEYVKAIVDTIEGAQESGTVKYRARDGATAYWHDGVLVIHNPGDPDKGTAYKFEESDFKSLKDFGPPPINPE